ncbi:hypothetical protein [Exiguobacterium sp. UBA5002]|uniref:hypothetical protein n=1 Tax=Exiguobacterium sp. UBA5002 TaxID=1946497 RepID=UPI0025C0E37F|nr:hypothetical protein [Exiguobacterium sp. UBA5002]
MRQSAIQNNFDWCRLVCEQVGCQVTETESTWLAKGSVPSYYPELMVRLPHQRINATDVYSIKDCTASYDFSSASLSHLFTAEWMTRPAILDRRALPVDWSVVTDATQFTRFQAIQATPELPTTLWQHPAVRFFYSEAQQASCIAYSNQVTTGLTYVNSDYLDERLWDDIARLSSAHFPGQSLVGYEYGDHLITALEAGFDDVGPLAIWIRTTNDHT